MTFTRLHTQFYRHKSTHKKILHITLQKKITHENYTLKSHQKV